MNANESYEQAQERISNQRAHNLMEAHKKICQLLSENEVLKKLLLQIPDEYEGEPIYPAGECPYCFNTVKELTDEEIVKVCNEVECFFDGSATYDFARAILRKAQEK